MLYEGTLCSCERHSVTSFIDIRLRELYLSLFFCVLNLDSAESAVRNLL